MVCLVWGVPGPGGLLPGGVPGRGGGLLLGGCMVQGVCSQGVSQHALRQTPLPPVDRHTLVKILPWPNFVAAGKKSGKSQKILSIELI